MSTLKDEKEIKYAQICGKNIKRLREEGKYSQNEIAELLGCSEITLGRVERGVQTMKFWRLVKLCDFFHVSLDYLLRDFDASDVSPIPSYFVRLFQDADPVEIEILSDHMMAADRAIKRYHAWRTHLPDEDE